MEKMRDYFDGEWESICKLLSPEEQPDFSAHLLEYIPPATEQNNYFTDDPSHFTLGNSYPSFLPSPENSIFQDSSLSNEISLCFDDFPVDGKTNGLFGMKFLDSERNEIISTDYSSSIISPIIYDHSNNNNSLNLSSSSNELSLKRKSVEEDPRLETEQSICQSETHKKARICKTEELSQFNQKLNTIAKLWSTMAQNRKKKADLKSDEEAARAEEETEARQRQSLSSDSSDDDSNKSENSKSSKSVITTSTRKKRACRGEATDPQSLYARSRRRRINERLRILQSLVPNGTKVDISTMLEEAFNYVKFLQLQIKLLSSDDLWMYAPLAYNGFDVQFYGKFDYDLKSGI